jgi:hypothetical protein
LRPGFDRVRAGALVIAAAVALWGTIAAVHYHTLGLTLAHFDARAHLVVARRIFDNIIPGWQQVGAVWLPLPHLLDALPVQIDYFYRTGFSGVAISIASMALAAWAIATLIGRSTGSLLGGIVAAALMMLNPDVLYLQSTPMSEPLLFGTTFLAVCLVARWLRPPSRDVEEPRFGGTAAPAPTRAAGWALVAATLSRFEAWLIVAALVVLAFVALLLMRSERERLPLIAAFRNVRGLALWPLWTLAAFLVNSKITVGSWFVSSGFFIPENRALGHPWIAWTQVWDGLKTLTGPWLPWIACVAALFVAVGAVRRRERAPLLLVLALFACAILPWGAYLKGHPVRLRYDVPLVAACAAAIGTAVALLPVRLRAIAAVVVIVLAIAHARPFDTKAPVVVESQRDANNSIGRRAVTAYLATHWDHQPIMMSMGSLAHYMHDLSSNGMNVRDFLHEGNGEIWRYAILHPQPIAEWIAIDEIGRGGDALYWRTRVDPAFLAGYRRVAEGGGVALYRRIRSGIPR